jgi:hypothetical protein
MLHGPLIERAQAGKREMRRPGESPDLKRHGDEKSVAGSAGDFEAERAEGTLKLSGETEILDEAALERIAEADGDGKWRPSEFARLEEAPR